MSEAATRRLIIEFVSDVSQLKTGFTEAQGFGDKLKAGAKGILKVAAPFVTVGAAAAVMKESIDAAVTDEASVSALAAQMDALKIPKENQKSVEDFIDKLSLTKGVADDELRPAFAQLLRSTGDTTEAMEQLGLAQDIAAGKGISVGAAADILAKATVGNLKPLQQLGVKLDDASKYGEGTEGIFKKLATVFKGAGDAAADTAEGKLKKMSLGFEEMKEKLGYILLPVFEKFVDWMNVTFIPTFDKVVFWFKEHWPEIHAKIVEVFEKVKGYVVPVIEFLKDLWEKFGDNIVNRIKGAWDAVRDIVQGAFELVAGIFNFFKDLLTLKWDKLWGDITQAVGGLGQLLKGAIEAVWTEIKYAVGIAWDIIKDTITGTWDRLYEFFTGLPAKLLSFFVDSHVWLFDKAKDIILGLVHGLEAAWSDIFTWFFNLPGRILQGLTDAAEWLVDLGRRLVKGIVKGIKEAPGALRDALISLIPGGKSVVDEVLKWVPGLSFAEGGPVPGPKGRAQLAVVHGGEYVLSNAMLSNGSGGAAVTNNITINLSDMDGSKLIALIKRYTQQNGPGWMVA